MIWVFALCSGGEKTLKVAPIVNSNFGRNFRLSCLKDSPFFISELFPVQVHGDPFLQK